MDYPVKHNLDDAQHKVAATQESQKPKIDDGQGAESVEKQGVFDCGQEAADLAMHRGGLEFPATQIMEQATQDFPNPEVESSQIKKPKIAEGQSELDVSNFRSLTQRRRTSRRTQVALTIRSCTRRHPPEVCSDAGEPEAQDCGEPK